MKYSEPSHKAIDHMFMLYFNCRPDYHVPAKPWTKQNYVYGT